MRVVRYRFPVILASVPEPEYTKRKAEQIMGFVITTERGCMEWQGCRSPHPVKNYGYIGMKGCKKESTHRVVYRGMRGPIPEGWDVCHTCDNPPCVNPLHLFAAPRVANLIDMRNKGRNRQTQKTHCPQQHEYTPENTIIDSRGWRRCKICDAARYSSERYLEYGRAYQRRKRELARALQSGKSVNAEKP